MGRGTLFSQARLMFGEMGDALQLTLIPDHPGFLVAILPPGAFIGLGLLIAGRNWLASRQAGTTRHGAEPAPQGREASA